MSGTARIIPLSVDDFAAYFRELNDGCDPFPWQERLARQVIQDGKWPGCLDLPTGTGKTAVLEIALFHLALEARKGSERRAPVRIAFVVDRRLIVDQTFVRARRIAEILRPTDETVAGRVAQELAFLAGEGNPTLLVNSLRGGIPRETDWARTPTQPTVLLSTVDQVGSRLLFRGYGVSASMRPIHAGLLGSDCLHFLDEAHLSEPFRQTLHWIDQYRRRPWCEQGGPPWSSVAMSATLAAPAKSVFSLDTAVDLKNQILRKRVDGSKPTELREVSRDGLVKTYLDIARDLAARNAADKVLIVVNRVDLARAIFEEFNSDDAVLLTGRVRELNRERIVQELQEKLKEPGRKLFAVATQCVEVGADYDFDALLTQIAPLDALRQRFGRLNRTGREIPAAAVILATKEDLPSKKPDPIYGFAAKETWALLKKIARVEGKRAVVDFATTALSRTIASLDIRAACCERLNAPVMPPAYIDLWTCTSPQPSMEPDVALYLHGPERAGADVEVVWRADISEELFKKPDSLEDLLTLIPPRTGETLSVPVWSVRQWLLGDKSNAARISDTEGESERSDAELAKGKQVIRWAGSGEEGIELVFPGQIRPGDVIIVPSSYGGCDDWGWTGRNDEAVRDLAQEAAARRGASTVAVRLHPNLFSAEEWKAIAVVMERVRDEAEQLCIELREIVPEQIRQELDQMAPRTERVAFFYDEDHPEKGLILTGRRAKRRLGEAEPSTENDRAGSFASDTVTLVAHTRSVIRKTQEFAACGGLTEPVQRALEFAAELHDSGKGDRRFQAYLGNGGVRGNVLAKSSRQLAPAAEQRLRQALGLPERWRHEALSVRLAIEHPRFHADGDVMDRELALWLIGTHHGYGRPFFPHDDPLDDCKREISGPGGEPVLLKALAGPQRLDFEWNGCDWAELFNRLRRRYGPWELARVEAILRLADHRASEEVDVERAHSTGSGTR